MPVGLCELIPFERLREWRRDVSEASPYLWPIFISMMLTQIIWVGVYQCSAKNNIVKVTRYMAGDRSLLRSNSTRTFDFDLEDPNTKTIRDYTIETLQFVAIMVVLFVITFLILWFASKFRKGELRVDAFIALHMSSYCASTVVRDTTNLLDIDPSSKQLIAGSCSLVYFCGAVLALFTDIFPSRISKYFGLTNHVFLSVVMLNLLPGGSLWTITTAVFLFVGLACCISARMGRGQDHNTQKPGPIEKEEMNADRRRFKIYEVEVQQTPYVYAQDQIETSQSDKYIVETGEIMYGEFLACSILVGLSMTYGIFPGIVSACGVLIGIVWSVNSKEQELMTVYSILFCFCGHFGTLIVQYALIFIFKTTA